MRSVHTKLDLILEVLNGSVPVGNVNQKNGGIIEEIAALVDEED